jgi:hypothetical protein
VLALQQLLVRSRRRAAADDGVYVSLVAEDEDENDALPVAGFMYEMATHIMQQHQNCVRNCRTETPPSRASRMETRPLLCRAPVSTFRRSRLPLHPRLWCVSRPWTCLLAMRACMQALANPVYGIWKCVPATTGWSTGACFVALHCVQEGVNTTEGQRHRLQRRVHRVVCEFDERQRSLGNPAPADRPRHVLDHQRRNQSHRVSFRRSNCC